MDNNDNAPRRGSHSAPADGTPAAKPSGQTSPSSTGRHDASAVAARKQQTGALPSVEQTAAPSPAPAPSDEPVGMKSATRGATGKFKPVADDKPVSGTHAQGSHSQGSHSAGAHTVMGVKAATVKDAPKKSRMGGAIIALVVIVAVIAAALFLGPKIASQFFGPGVEPGQPVEIVVAQGSSSSAIADQLKEAGVIRSTRQFKQALVNSGADKSIYPGKYKSFVTGMSDEEAMAVLVKGPDDSYFIAIPEGYTLAQIAQTVEAQSEISAADFIAEVRDASVWAGDYPFLADAGTNSLEGFLFPKTYEVKEETTAHELAKMMLDQYVAEVSAVDFSAAASKNLTEYDVIIIASMIEKETVNETQRPDVASVVYNRLRAGMKLQFDSTVIYALGDEYDGGGNVSYDHLAVDSPYNTYIVSGLPAGPICSPGITAIQAAAAPSETDYLYFVNENIEGDLLFSSDYNEFLANKEAYEALLAASGA